MGTTFRLHSCHFMASTHSPPSFQCDLTNTGTRTGDEVVQVYHVAQSIGTADHPLPKRALIDFTRVTLSAGATTSIIFPLTFDALKVVNKEGVRTLYPGIHRLIASRGSPGDEQM